MGLFSKNKISTYDSLKEALDKKRSNKSISAKTINKLTEKLNNAKTVEEIRTAHSSLQNYQNPQIQARIESLFGSNKNVNQILDKAEAHKKIQKIITTGIKPTQADTEAYQRLANTLANENYSTGALKSSLEENIFLLPSLSGLPRNNPALNNQAKALNNTLFFQLNLNKMTWVSTSVVKSEYPSQNRQNDTDKAMQYIWSTNAGYKAIQHMGQVNTDEVIEEIKRVSPGFFDGKKEIKTKIKYFNGNIATALNDYILKCRTKEKDYYRGVSRTEAEELRQCARTKQPYKPKRFLATTTSSTEAQNFPTPDRHAETVRVTGRAAVINSAYAVSEREHLFSRDDKFRVDIRSNNQIHLPQIS